VGKSSILVRFIDNTFAKAFVGTVGVDYKVFFLILHQLQWMSVMVN